MAAAEGSGPSGSSADSYIGSLISLTSKYEIRYEGVLYNINTEESSIGLRNVRSFGTEGRKKDGPQIAPSDKIYEYILFRGSDIKDLQVKSSPPPVQQAVPPPPIHNDPAIIQSHYPLPTSMPSVGGGTGSDLTGQGGIPRTSFQGNLPPYLPGGSLGSWGSSPVLPNANGSGFGMPMYWQGFYAPSGGLPPHLQQTPLLRPPPGSQLPQSLQQPLQYPGINTQLPSQSLSLSSGAPSLSGASTSAQNMASNSLEAPSLLPPLTSTVNLVSTALPSTVAPPQAASLANEIPQTHPPSRTSVATTNVVSSVQNEKPLVSKPESMTEPIPSKPRVTTGSNLTHQPVSQAPLTDSGFSSISQVVVVVKPSLVTPDQLVPSGNVIISTSQPLNTAPKEPDVRTVPELSKRNPMELKDKEVIAPSKGPILPTPDRKIRGSSLQTHTHHNNRGRGRGRGNGHPRSVTTFTEEFDFNAMNEKFNKDEVWGHLGKGKGSLREGEENSGDDFDTEEEDYTESSKKEIKSGYVKDDFFDSLSCNALDRGGRNGRTKFSEQLKLDAETFGDLSKQRPTYRGGRGGRGGFRGGRTAGSFYGRGYGYTGRGRGRNYPVQSRAS